MYKGSTLTGPDMVKSATADPFGPMFSTETVDKAASMEIWHSSFNDPGADFNEFVLKGASGEEITKKRIEGY